MRKTVFIGLLTALVLAGGRSEEKAARPAAKEDTVAVRLADGLKLTLWAPASMVASPVAVALDDRGAAYVTRTNRRKTSVLDIRAHTGWMTDDLSLQTVADKRAFLHRILAPDSSAANVWLEDRNGDGVRDWRDLTVESEQVLRLSDTDGDGTADSASVFAEGFNTDVTGVAAGVLPFEGDVFVAVAPDLWRLRDADGDGRADTRTSISFGYGNHLGFAGHDMSGLTVGPDGMLYWAIGDLGVHVEGPDGRAWRYPDQGAVMRCNPDGSDFEVFAHGLRNTQELAFDEYGNLFSVDNDGDYPGEHERVVYLVDGSDSGWRTSWQYGKYDRPDNNRYNVWLAEELHRPYFDGQAAYITPPVAPAEDGPAGFAYDPGTALGDAWRGYFFVAQFTGTAARSHVNAFRVRPKGASFERVEQRQVLQGIQTTGMAFGPDGALYLADWLEGWDKKDAGRVWKLDVDGAAASPLRAQTRRLLAEGMAGRPVDALAALLGHADMRVRTKAQFELVRRGDAGRNALLAATRRHDYLPARLHGIWGLGQLGRRPAGDAAPLVDLLRDGEAEVRAQAARTLGACRYRPALQGLIALLRDDEARVRFFAAEALGRLADRRATAPLLDMLEASDDADPYLRHAGALALARIGAADTLVGLAAHPSRAVRLAAVVALRRLQHPGLASFLADPDERVVTEAARAIHDDFSVAAALPALGQVLDRDDLAGEPLLRRAINANLRLGGAVEARRLAAFAARGAAPEAMRAEALLSLGTWPNPPLLDRVDGRYRPLGRRDTALVRAAAAPFLETVLTAAPDTVRFAAAEMAGKLRDPAAGARLFDLLVADPSPVVRLAALNALGEMRHERLAEAVEASLNDEDGRVRRAGRRLTARLSRDAAVALLATVLEHGSEQERQGALASLGAINTDAARDLLSAWMDSLLAGTVPEEIRLDLLEAARRSRSEELAGKVERYRASKPQDDPLVDYLETLAGGDPEAGRAVVFGHPSAQCIRCHRIHGQGGAVGPDLTEVGARSGRRALLESLVAPGAVIAPGYGTVVLKLKDGRTLAGILGGESPTQVLVEQGDGQAVRVDREDIVERTDAPSAMPPMGGILTRAEVRDVIAYLAGLKRAAQD